MPAAAIIPAIGSIASAGIGALGSAGQSGAVSGANAAAQAQYAQSRNDLMPWMSTGTQANTQGADLLGLNGQDAANAAMSTYQQSPGYQWQFDQGLRGIDAGAASKGLLHSGATIKGEQTFGQGLANSDFGQYYNRLMGLSGQGLTAAGDVSNIAARSASASIGQGNAQSSIYGNAAGGLSGNVNNLLSNKNFQNSLFPSSSPNIGNFDPFAGNTL